MPEMNGYETTKAIRNLPDRPDGKKIPIIAMTANAFAEDVQAALNAGMDDHVAKPVDMEYFNICHHKIYRTMTHLLKNGLENFIMEWSLNIWY